jgi:hypothetical protein
MSAGHGDEGEGRGAWPTNLAGWTALLRGTFDDGALLMAGAVLTSVGVGVTLLALRAHLR